MPRPKKIPSYCLHKATGQAYVTVDGRERYLGKHGSPESQEKYARVIAERFSNPSSEPEIEASFDELTVTELIAKYWKEFVEVVHTKDGKPTDRQYHIRLAMRPLNRLYGTLSIQDFGPKRLKTVRDEMIHEAERSGKKLNRKYINDHVSIIRRMFKWAVSEELVNINVSRALDAVEGLRKGADPRVSESKKIKPVMRAHILAVKNVASPQIRDMIGLQELTGMRPDEVTTMRRCDIDMNGNKSGLDLKGSWVYRPYSHKCDWRDLDRFVPLGPKCQEIIRPWFHDRSDDAYLFSPQEVVESMHAAVRKSKRSVVWKSRKPRERYDDESYCQAVRRLCEKIEIPIWTPNQLRHTAATKLRAAYGIEAARVILGHTTIATTEIYAEKDLKSAIDIMLDVG